MMKEDIIGELNLVFRYTSIIRTLIYLVVVGH